PPGCANTWTANRAFKRNCEYIPNRRADVGNSVRHGDWLKGCAGGRKSEDQHVWRLEDLWQSRMGHQPRVKLPVSLALRPPAMSVPPCTRGHARLLGGGLARVG